MANRYKNNGFAKRNHNRQERYLREGIVMLPTLYQERKGLGNIIKKGGDKK